MRLPPTERSHLQVRVTCIERFTKQPRVVPVQWRPDEVPRSCIIRALCRRHSSGADERRSLLDDRSHAARRRASNAGGVVPR